MIIVAHFLCETLQIQLQSLRLLEFLRMPCQVPCITQRLKGSWAAKIRGCSLLLTTGKVCWPSVGRLCFRSQRMNRHESSQVAHGQSHHR